MTPSLTLASASASRARLLDHAGVVFGVDAAHIDEASIKSAMAAEGASAAHIAETLAETKTLKISRRREGFVLGADQMLACDGVFFDKPRDREEARQTLTALRGRTHTLPTAACIAKNGAVIWRVVKTPELTMRGFSDAFVETYLDRLGDKVFTSVGAYHLEGLGAQLFTEVKGDFFTVLGLPLLEILEFLRLHRILAR